MNPEPAAGSMSAVSPAVISPVQGSPESNLPLTPDAPVSVENTVSTLEPAVTSPVAYMASYGTIEIPKLGEGWTRPLFEGTTDEVMDLTDDKGRSVAARYVNTEPFGALGNSAISGHSGGVYDLNLVEQATGNYDSESLNYSPFTRLDELVSGDALIINTAEGRYTYGMLWTEVTDPRNNDVLYDQVYRTGAKTAGDEVQSALVLTTCGVLEDLSGDDSIRRIAYFELTGFDAV